MIRNIKFTQNIFLDFYSFCLYDHWIFDLCKLLSASIFSGAYFSSLAWVMHAFTPPLNLMCDHSQNLLNLARVPSHHPWKIQILPKLLNGDKTRRCKLDSRHEGLKQKPLIRNSGGTLRLEQQETTEQLKHRGLKQQLKQNEHNNLKIWRRRRKRKLSWTKQGKSSGVMLLCTWDAKIFLRFQQGKLTYNIISRAMCHRTNIHTLVWKNSNLDLVWVWPPHRASE